MIDRKFIGYKSPVFDVDVEKGRLRLFAKALGESNPVYTDERAAHRAGYRSLPVMPTFFFCLEMEQADPYAWFNDLGVPLANALHAEQSFKYHEMAFAGDVLTYASEVTDIFDKKEGALVFVRQDTSITNQARQLVAEFRRTIVIQAR
ncbi:MAG: MaoC family dehydratase N-terminal domain-containing protein [Gammaproteobacteria bacterium]